VISPNIWEMLVSPKEGNIIRDNLSATISPLLGRLRGVCLRTIILLHWRVIEYTVFNLWRTI